MIDADGQALIVGCLIGATLATLIAAGLGWRWFR